MKKLFIFSAIALFIGFNAQAIEINPYVSGKVNFNFQDHDLGDGFSLEDKVFGGSVALGIASSKELPIRAEFEFGMMSKAEDSFLGAIDGSAKITSYMANFYYDFYNTSDFIPYAGFGLGATSGKLTLTFKDDPEDSGSLKKTEFSWQVGAGSYYKINEELFADLGVKYGQVSFDDVDSELITISLGLRYNF